MKRNYFLVFLWLPIYLFSYQLNPDYAPITSFKKAEETSYDYNEWLTFAPLPTTRAHQMTAFCVVGGEKKWYSFGGFQVSGGAVQNIVLEYDVRTNTWQERAPMPTARAIGRAAYVGKTGKIYVIGGCQTFGTGLNVVEIYDPATNSWTTGAPMPVGNHDFGIGVWRDSLIYVIGGGNWSATSPPINSVYLYNPFTNSWSSCTPMPQPMGTPGAGIIGDTIVVSTGYQSAGATNITFIGTINPENPTQITWTTGPSCPGTIRYRTICGVYNDELFLVGGNTAAGITAETRSYNPRTNTWSQWANKPTAVSNVYGIAVDPAGMLYVAGGYNGTTYVTAHEGLDLRQFNHDVGVIRILPSLRIRPNIETPFIGVVKNFGLNPETFTTTCLVYDSIGDTLLIQKDTTISLSRGDTLAIEFGRITPSVGRVYKITVYTVLTGDEDPTNDTMRTRVEVKVGSEPCGFGYIYESTQEPDTVRFLWIDPTAGTPITGWYPNADDGYVQRTLPFPFRYYGQTFNTIYVSTNGFLSDSAAYAFSNTGFPTAIRNHICGWWDDLDLRTSGTVYQYNDPQGNFVVFAWVNVPRYNAPSEVQTFQIVLYRNGVIRYNYLSMTGTLNSNTVGIQGIYGANRWYHQYVYNGQPSNHIVDDSVSIIFYYPPYLNICEEKYEKVIKMIYSLPNGKGNCEIYNLNGQLIKRFSLEDKKAHQKELRKGIYFLKVKREKSIENYKLIITQ
ncbi:MAG: kelch repeat-containing protein [candidate division WOR-3 bacterium]|nr:kelch repeat-containing protein [candidate division WOR-3 bacterium]